MMNKTKSTKRQLLRMLFLLPATAILLLAFRNRWETAQKNFDRGSKGISETIIMNDTVPPTLPVAPLPPIEVKLPENVQRINVNNDKATIWLKNGKKENYNLAVASEKEAFEKKYGEIPVPPIPPIRPTTPILPAKTTNLTPAAAPIVNNEINLTGISSEYEITDKMAVIKLKDGAIEKYDLTNPKDRAVFERKYGKIVPLNTNITPNIKPTLNKNINVVLAPVSNVSVNSVITPAPAIAPRISSARGNVVIRDDYGYTITGNEAIVITITKNTSRQQLEDFKKQMKEIGIDLSFDEVKYNEKGSLISINGTMKSGDSRSNFVAADFNKLVLAMIRKGDQTYFKVSTSDNKEVI